MTKGNFEINLFFPKNSGENPQSFNLSTNNCSSLLDCLNLVSNVSCSYYQSVGALSCPNVTQTCFINSINGVSAQDYGFGAFWKIKEANKTTPIGVSCLPVFSNANYSIAISNNLR